MEFLKQHAHYAAQQERKNMKNAYQSKEPQNTSCGTASTAETRGRLETFLTERGIDPEIAWKYGVSESEGRIEIGYKRDGEIVKKKYRTFDKKFFQDPGVQFFWNIDVLKDESLKDIPLIITEGEFDALSAIQSGYPRTMSVPNGAQSLGEVPAYLDEVLSKLRDIPEIVLATDSDEPGIKLMEDLSIHIGKGRCKFVKYPNGCKDLNDALRIYGEKGVQVTLQKAAWIRVDGVYKMGDLPPVSYRQPHDIGIVGFENHLKIRKGDFSVITGVPSCGKTAFVTDITCRLNHKYGWKIGVASFEQHPQTDYKRNLRTWHAGKLAKGLSEEEKQTADKWIDDAFVFIVPSDDDVTLEWTLERASVAVLRHGVQMLIIDPWNEMDHTRPYGLSLTEYTGMAIKEFKKFAKKYNVHVMVVAHPAKMQRAKDGNYPVPSLYDISDSAHWYNKADLGIVVHRSENGDFVQIVKSRYHTEIGKPGVVDVKFSLDTGRYMVVDNSALF